MRKLLSSGTDIPPLSELVVKTEILPIIDHILSCDSDEEDYRFLRLEAIWIATNLACAGAEELKYLLASSFVDLNLSEESLTEDFKYGKSTILARLDKLMKQIISRDCKDLKSINLIIQLLANIAHTDTHFAKKVMTETSLTDMLAYLICNTPMIEPKLLENCCSVVMALAKSPELSKSEIEVCS